MSGETDFSRQADYIAEKMRLPVAIPYKPTPFVKEPTFENVEVSRLESPVSLRYLADRGIPKDTAQRYCVQVDYELHGKRYYAIGFENFEGFIDFLSAERIGYNDGLDTIVLNSVANIQKAIDPRGHFAGLRHQKVNNGVAAL